MPWFFMGVTFLFLLLAGRLFYLQIIKGDYYREKGEQQWTQDLRVSALRGSILDCNGNVLAQSATSMTVVLRPGQIASADEDGQEGQTARYVAQTLAPILQMDEAYIYEQATRTDAQELWLKRQISLEQEEQIIAADLPGVGFAEDFKRYYIRSNFLSQVLGYTNVDGVGQEGLEASYNKYLIGTDGQVVSEKSANGDDLPFSNTYYVDAVDGYNVVTTIDYVIQSFAEQAIEDAMAELDAEKIEVIVMEPDTGRVLAMAKKPDMDNNNLPRDDAALLAELSRNTLITDSYEPGSTFKIITAASALDMGVTDTQELFTCTGSITVDSDTIRCWRYYNPHGTQDLQMALRNSCNPIFVTLALRMGTEDFYSYIRNFGFGQRTGIDLYGEATGIVTNEKYVRNTDLARIGFGQSIAVTPIQMITAVSAVVNGGNLMEPYLVDRVEDQDGNVVAQFNPTFVRRVIREETSETMRQMLQFVVDDGVSNARIEGVAVGGKTGTAQKYDENGQIRTDAHVASFVGFLPADDPELVVLVIVDSAKTYADTGSQIAAPIAQTIMQQSYQYLRSVSGDQTRTQDVKVPNIVGMTPEQAEEILSGVGLTLELDGDMEYISSQAPASGVSVPAGTTVTGSARALGDAATFVQVPDLIGMKQEQAQAALEEKGLVGQFSGTGRVTQQSIEAGTQVASGTSITVTLE
jgi:stage V sporulation protein D (sporulation-specific penicillin-binding protein)